MGYSRLQQVIYGTKIVNPNQTQILSRHIAGYNIVYTDVGGQLVDSAEIQSLIEFKSNLCFL